MNDDLEFIKLNMGDEPLPAARPQHLKFCRDLMNQKDWAEMVKGMPQTWWNLFLEIKKGEDTFNGAPILRKDVNTLVTQLKKCPSRRDSHNRHRREHNIAQDAQERREVERLPGLQRHPEGLPLEVMQPAMGNTDVRPPLAPRDQFATPKTTVELEDGMYRNPKTSTIYKVYHTVHGANVQVAKELIIVDPGERATPTSYRDGLTITPEEPWVRKPTVRFDYRGRKPLYSLKPAMRLTMEEAKQFGALYGTCCICGRMLTNELSIHLGIGPVCGSREFGGDFEFMVDDAKDYIDGVVESVEYEDRQAHRDRELAAIQAEMRELEGK